MISGSGRSPGEGKGNPLQYSCLENPMDEGAWQATVHGVVKSEPRLSDFTFTFHFHALEKEMATHSSVLSWRIPGTGEPGGQSRTQLKQLSNSSSVPLGVCIICTYIYYHVSSSSLCCWTLRLLS